MFGAWSSPQQLLNFGSKARLAFANLVEICVALLV
jgi:hypothetical protein